jgi:hypothetical protein
MTNETPDEPLIPDVLAEIANLNLENAAAELTDAGDVGVGRFALLLSDAAATFRRLIDLCYEREVPVDEHTRDVALVALGVTLVPVLHTPIGRPEHFNVPPPKWFPPASRAFQALKGFDFSARLAQTNNEQGEDPDVLLVNTTHQVGVAFQRLMQLTQALANTNENRRAVQRLLDETRPPKGPAAPPKGPAA